jgi:hypothetical protein
MTDVVEGEKMVDELRLTCLSDEQAAGGREGVLSRDCTLWDVSFQPITARVTRPVVKSDHCYTSTSAAKDEVAYH